MGQGSSLEVSSPVPTVGNLMVDASDSFVTELKLRSTGIIPISEYIKNEKYKKNVQRLEQVKKVDAIDTNEQQSVEDASEEQEARMRRNKKGSDFIETSYEDVPENRVWIMKPSRRRIGSSSVKQKKRVKDVSQCLLEEKHYSDHLIIPQKHPLAARRTVEKQTTTSDAPPEVTELYHRKHREHRPKRPKNKKNVKTSSTDLRNFRRRHTVDDDAIREKDNSTHNVRNHHFNLFQFPHRIHNKPKLTVQTNLSCTIPPNKYLMPCIKKSSSHLLHRPNNEQDLYVSSAKHLKTTAINNKSNKKSLRFATPPPLSKSSLSLTPEDSCTQNDVPRRGLSSARQALESWKNIHVQKYRERNRTLLPPKKRAQEIAEDSDEIPICRNSGPTRRDKCLQTEGSLRPSKEFIDDIERCLQRHSHLSDLYLKRNGGAKSTWVQDKYRRWHKITFEDN